MKAPLVSVTISKLGAPCCAVGPEAETGARELATGSWRGQWVTVTRKAGSASVMHVSTLSPELNFAKNLASLLLALLHCA